MRKKISTISILIICILSIIIFKYKYSQENITLYKIDKESSNNIMSIEYYINNLKNEKYLVNIYCKEYKEGNLVNNYELYNEHLENKSDNTLKIKAFKNKELLNVEVDEFKVSKELYLFANNQNNLAFSTIAENKKKFKLNEEIPIAMFSSGKTIGSLDIEEYSKKNPYNENDFIVFLKIS